MSNQKLFKLLSVLNAASSAAEEEIDFESIVSNIHKEVDYYHQVLGRLKCEELWLDKQIEDLTDKRIRIRKNIKSFNNCIKNAMVFNEAPKVPGEKWKIRLRPKTYIQVYRTADQDMLERFPGCVTKRVSYRWNKTKIKQELKKDNLDLANFATQVKDYDPVFSAHTKGVNK